MEEEKKTILIDECIELLEANKNIILHGAPGTGKSYLAVEIAKKMTGAESKDSPFIGFCQFHPSFDYTDFVEGLRPTNDKDTSTIGFKRQDGLYKDFCKKAIFECFKENPEIYVDKFKNEIRNNKSFSIESKTGKPFTVALSPDDKIYVEQKTKQFISVEDIKRNIDTVIEDGAVTGGETYNYAVCKFIIKNIIGKVEATSEKSFVFIIDEINRGDISKIFGELFYAIDPGYRGKEGKIKTQYQNLVPNDDVFYDGFYVPENVYIIGTMNDIDRSVESMDFAIRRRFAWKEITPDNTADAILEDVADKDVIIKKMKSLNEEIERKKLLGPAFQIGPSYFAKYNNYKEEGMKDAIDKLWELHIEPLLREYTRGFSDQKELMDSFKSKIVDSNKEKDSAEEKVEDEQPKQNEANPN